MTHPGALAGWAQPTIRVTYAFDFNEASVHIAAGNG